MMRQDGFSLINQFRLKYESQSPNKLLPSSQELFIDILHKYRRVVAAANQLLIYRFIVNWRHYTEVLGAFLDHGVQISVL